MSRQRSHTSSAQLILVHPAVNDRFEPTGAGLFEIVDGALRQRPQRFFSGEPDKTEICQKPIELTSFVHWISLAPNSKAEVGL